MANKPNKSDESVVQSQSRKFTYLLQLYNTMLIEAEGIEGEVIYTGKIVDTFASLSISMAYYTHLFDALKELGCIELLDRGVRGRPTRYRLHGAPTQEAYAARYVSPTSPASDLTDGAKAATVSTIELDQRIKNIERRLSGVKVKQILANLEERIVTLERITKGGSE